MPLTPNIKPRNVLPSLIIRHAILELDAISFMLTSVKLMHKLPPKTTDPFCMMLRVIQNCFNERKWYLFKIWYFKPFINSIEKHKYQKFINSPNTSFIIYSRTPSDMFIITYASSSSKTPHRYSSLDNYIYSSVFIRSFWIYFIILS